MKKTLLSLAILGSLASIATAAPITITNDNLDQLKGEMVLNTGDSIKLNVADTFGGDNDWGIAENEGIVNWTINGGTIDLHNFALFHTGIKESSFGDSLLVVNDGTLKLNHTKTASTGRLTTTLNTTDMIINGGKITLSAADNTDASTSKTRLGAYKTFTMNGGEISLQGNSKIWLATVNSVLENPVEGDLASMNLLGGTVTMTGKGALIHSGNDSTANTLILGGTNVIIGTAPAQTQTKTQHIGSLRSNQATMTAGEILVHDNAVMRSKMTNGFNFNGGKLTAHNIVVNSTTGLDTNNIASGTAQFNTLTVNGGSIVTDSVTVATGSTLTIAAHTDVFTQKTVAPATRKDKPLSITNNGTVAISGLTARDNGATVESLIGIGVNNTSGGNINAAPDAFINKIEFDKNGKLTVTLNDKVDINSQYTDAAYAAYAGTGSMNDQVVQHLVTLGTVGTDAKTLAAFDQKTTDLATSYAKSGLYNVAYDAQSLVNDTIGTRAVRGTKQGTGVWVDVFGSTNEAELNGTAGYEADIYGGVFGADYALSDSWTLGGAIVFGTAEANGTNNAYAQDIDSDFYGLSVYTSKNFSGLTLTADAGYTAVENDIGALSADADVWTLGVRGEFAAYESDVLAVRPHFGVRYMSIDTDNVGVTENEKLNVFEMPVGVAFEGKFDAAGMKFVPMADFEVVQQLGDKEIEVHALGTYADDVNVVEGTAYRATFGLGAEMGQATFGLNYRYTGSNKDRNDHMIQARFGYQF